jgi:ATP-dependent Clp protease ATP-binding subunit ClpC
MYERFTDRARKVMQLANQEAQRLYHEYIGTEHLLLGLLKEGSGVGANVLKNLDITLPKIRREVEQAVKSGTDGLTAGKLLQTPQVKRVIGHSIEEARSLHHNYVGTEHLLLGLLHEREGVAAQILMNLGLKLAGVRAEVLDLLGQLDSSERSALNEVSKITDGHLTDLAPATQEAVRELEAEINRIIQERQDAIAGHDSQRTAILRDRADRLKKKLLSLVRLLM